jgi:hypothetical protein
MTPTDPDILCAVPLAEAAERTGLRAEDILALARVSEPDGLDGNGPVRPIVRSYPTDSGLMVSLVNVIDVARGLLAIVAGTEFRY